MTRKRSHSSNTSRSCSLSNSQPIDLPNRWIDINQTVGQAKLAEQSLLLIKKLPLSSQIRFTRPEPVWVVLYLTRKVNTLGLLALSRISLLNLRKTYLNTRQPQNFKRSRIWSITQTCLYKVGAVRVIHQKKLNRRKNIKILFLTVQTESLFLMHKIEIYQNLIIS